jgi:hypothetical protein
MGANKSKNIVDGAEVDDLEVDEFYVNEQINKLFDASKGLINKSNLDVRITNLSNGLLETSKIMKNCISCKDRRKYIKHHIDGLYRSINEMESLLVKLKKVEQGKEYIVNWLDQKLVTIDNDINKNLLCNENCKKKKKEFKEMIDNYGNLQIARFFLEKKPNLHNNDGICIEWIPFNEFRNIEYLAKGCFGEVYKAIWIKYKDIVLKRLYNSSNKIFDILEMVKKV